MNSRRRPGASFRTRLTLWLLLFQGLLWVAVVPWNFLTSAQTIRQLQNPALGAQVKNTWEAARALQTAHPEVKDQAEWKALTTALEGVRREEQANRSLQTDVLVQGFRGMAAAALLQLAGLVLSAFLAAGALSRQVRTVHLALVRLREGDRLTRLPELRGREFGLLGEEFNRLLDGLEAQEARLSELGKLLGWQETARFLSHQIKNPLTALGLAAQNLEDLGALSSPLARQNAEILREESDKLLRLVNRLKELTGFGELRPESLDLAALAAEVAQRAFPVPVSLAWDGPAPFVLTADRMLVEQLFLNLVLNAAEASSGDPVVVTIRVEGRSLWVTDSHRDLDPTLPSRLFRPPFTTKATGTGLGLSFCRRILQLHGGQLDADLSPVGGLRFHLTFGEAHHG